MKMKIIKIFNLNDGTHVEMEKPRDGMEDGQKHFQHQNSDKSQTSEGNNTSKGVSEIMTLDTVKLLAGEFLGTFLLVMIGCMGCLPGWSSGAPSHLQICISFGMAVMFVVQIFGHISGAHVNPSVTLCGVVCGCLTIPMAILYMLAQVSGATAGYGLLFLVTPDKAFNSTNNMCVTMPDASVSLGQAVLVEAVITSVLILLTCAVWDPCNSHNSDSVPLKFGFTVAGLAMAAGAYTGASMNPARSLGPALWNNNWTHHWVYWIGPLLGSATSSALYTYFFKKKAIKSQPEEIPLNENSNKRTETA